MANPTQIAHVNPVLEDRALLYLQQHLADRLPWLNYAFGRASKLAITRDGRQVYYPAYPANDAVWGKEYIPLWPDEHLGNFCFFELRDEQIITDWGRRDMAHNTYRFGASLIFSFNLRKIYGGETWKNVTPANVVNEVFVLALATFSEVGVSISADRYYHNTENVYRGYTHNEVKNQFNMRPYGCFRIDLDVNYLPGCDEESELSGIGYDIIGGTGIVYPG